MITLSLNWVFNLKYYFPILALNVLNDLTVFKKWNDLKNGGYFK